MSGNFPAVSANVSALQQMFNTSKVEETTGGGLSFLRFDSKRLGIFLFGADGEDVTDEIISVDVSTFKHGQIQWHKKKCSRRMVPINQPMPEAFEPIEYTDPAGKPQVDESQDGRSFEFTFVDGVRGLYETSTLGGRKAIDSVLKDLRARAAAGNPYFFPHVVLKTSSYKHDSWGLVYNPELEVVAWYDGDGNLEQAGGAAKLAPPPAAPAQKAPPKRRATGVGAAAPAASEAPEVAHDAADGAPWEGETPSGQDEAPAPRRRTRVPG